MKFSETEEGKIIVKVHHEDCLDWACCDYEEGLDRGFEAGQKARIGNSDWVSWLFHEEKLKQARADERAKTLDEVGHDLNQICIRHIGKCRCKTIRECPSVIAVEIMDYLKEKKISNLRGE